MKAVSDRVHTHLRLIFIVLAFLSGAGLVMAQSTSTRPATTPRPIDASNEQTSDERPLTSIEEELRAKRAIKQAEKDHRENLNRAREIDQLGKELRESLKNRSSIDRAALKRIERLEKLTRKIRGEAGGEDEDVSIADRPSDIHSAVTRIAEASETLSKDVQNTPRQVVSASVIGNANVLLELIKMLRAFVRQP